MFGLPAPIPGEVTTTAALENVKLRIAPLLARDAAGGWGEVGRLDNTEVSRAEMEEGLHHGRPRETEQTVYRAGRW